MDSLFHSFKVMIENNKGYLPYSYFRSSDWFYIKQTANNTFEKYQAGVYWHFFHTLEIVYQYTVHSLADISSRIQMINIAVGKFESRVISIKSKVSVYTAFVIISRLYSSETSTPYRTCNKWLDRFYQKCLRCILNIKYYSLIPDTVVLKRCEYKSTETIIIPNQMRCTGYVVRTGITAYQYFFYEELKTGKHPKQKLTKKFKDNLKDYLKVLYMDVQHWKELTLNRTEWRHFVK